MDFEIKKYQPSTARQYQIIIKNKKNQHDFCNTYYYMKLYQSSFHSLLQILFNIRVLSDV